MNPDYTQAQLMSDIMAVVSENAPVIVTVSIFLGVVNFVVGWFMYSLFTLTRESFGSRRS